MANVRNDTISIDFDHFVHIELFLPRYKTEYHLVFIPLHRLHLSGQSAYSSVFEVKPHSVFFMYCAKAPYERCVQIV